MRGKTIQYHLILILSLPITHQAANANFTLSPTPKNLTYRSTGKAKDFASINKRVGDLAARQSLDDSPAFAKLKGLDLIAVSNDGRKFMMMLYGANVEPIFRNKLFTAKKTWIYHTDIRGQAVALGFQNINTQEIANIIRELKMSKTAMLNPNPLLWISNQILSPSECAAEQTGNTTPNPATTNATPGATMECIHQVGNGGWDVLKLPKTLVLDPVMGNIDHIHKAGWSKYWQNNVADFWNKVDDVSKQWKSFKTAIDDSKNADLKTTAKNLWGHFNTRPNLQALCRSTGQAIGSVGIVPVYAKGFEKAGGALGRSQIIAKEAAEKSLAGETVATNTAAKVPPPPAAADSNLPATTTNSTTHATAGAKVANLTDDAALRDTLKGWAESGKGSVTFEGESFRAPLGDTWATNQTVRRATPALIDSEPATGVGSVRAVPYQDYPDSQVARNLFKQAESKGYRQIDPADNFGFNNSAKTFERPLPDVIGQNVVGHYDPAAGTAYYFSGRVTRVVQMEENGSYAGTYLSIQTDTGPITVPIQNIPMGTPGHPLWVSNIWVAP